MACAPSSSTSTLLGCCGGAGTGCIRVRQMLVEHSANYHTFCNPTLENGSEVCASGTPHRFFLDADFPSGPPSNYPSDCTGLHLNRYTFCGTSAPVRCSTCGAQTSGELQYFSKEITPAEILSDLNALHNTPWPDPPTSFFYTSGPNAGKRIGRWRIEPTYNSAGGITVPAHEELEVFTPGQTLIPCLVSAYQWFSGVAPGPIFDESNHNWRVDHFQEQYPSGYKMKAQIYHEGAQFTGCLYESHAITLGKLNCRQIVVPPFTWIDIPAPAIGYNTWFDPHCSCQ